MRPTRVSLPPPLTDPKEPGFLPAAEQYVRGVRHSYDVRAHGHRRYYRVSGVVVILSGASLPLLTTLNFSHKDLTISLVGILVSAVTALRGFYRWDQMWPLLRATEFSVSASYWKWRGAVGDSAGTTDKAAADKQNTATMEMLKEIAEIRHTESSSFFKDLPFPHKG
jgi:Protein of unknown function (DUF4231)